MRVIFFAAADHGVTLAYAMQCGIIIGGMTPDEVQGMCDVFDADPDARLVVTAAYEHRADYPRPKARAAKYVIEGYFGSPSSAMRFCPDPDTPAPQTDWFLHWLEERRERLREAQAEVQTRQVTEQKLLPGNSACTLRQEGDEYVCHRHNRRWDVHEGDECPANREDI